MTTFSFRVDGCTESTIIPFSDTPFPRNHFDLVMTSDIKVSVKKVNDGLLLDDLIVQEYRSHRWWVNVEDTDPHMGMWHLELESTYIKFKRIHSLNGDPCYMGDLEITITN